MKTAGEDLDENGTVLCHACKRTVRKSLSVERDGWPLCTGMMLASCNTIAAQRNPQKPVARPSTPPPDGKAI